jgi:hypothetical protein
MNVEQLDGFFAALIAGLETVMPSEYEHDEDPEIRPDPIRPEKREQIIAGMAEGFFASLCFLCIW